MPVGALAESGTEIMPAPRTVLGAGDTASGPAAQIAAAASPSGDQLSAGLAQTIVINGNNPATISVGTTFGDLGAIITGPTEADKNLGLRVFVDGRELQPVETAQIDTSVAGEHTIDYVAQNSFGTATSTRTVIVEAPASTIVTAATSTDVVIADSAPITP